MPGTVHQRLHCRVGKWQKLIIPVAGEHIRFVFAINFGVLLGSQKNNYFKLLDLFPFGTSVSGFLMLHKNDRSIEQLHKLLSKIMECSSYVRAKRFPIMQTTLNLIYIPVNLQHSITISRSNDWCLLLVHRSKNLPYMSAMSLFRLQLGADTFLQICAWQRK